MTTEVDRPVSAEGDELKRADRPTGEDRLRTDQSNGTRRAHPGLGAYLARGWHLIPCHSVEDGICSCKKADCLDAGKHPMTRHGLKDASNDPEVVRRWYLAFPSANWAVRTGLGYGPSVIDVDRHGSDGFESLDRFEMDQRREPLPPTLRVRTGGGGLHLYFAANDLRSRNGWLGGVDVKSAGGYVLLPGSRHLSGRQYGWLNWQDWSSKPLPVMPEDVQSLLRGRSSRSNRGTGPDTASDLPPTAWLREHGFRSGERDNGFHAPAWRETRIQYPDRAGVERVITDVWRRTEQNGHLFPVSAALAKVERAWDDLGPEIEQANAWAQGLTRRTR